MQSSIILFVEHQKWKDMIWLVGYSPTWPSNLGIFEGSLADMLESWATASLINFLKYGKLRQARWSGRCLSHIGNVWRTRVCGNW